jgi:hypothetical protein
MVEVGKISNRSKGAGQLMIGFIAIALAAGCASALMYASLMSGEPISLVLFLLAPLPLMVAGLGWGPLAACIGGIAAAAGFGFLFGLPHSIAFAVAVALPAWWLAHLALLGRPAAHAAAAGDLAAPQFEWYPIGRIVLWIGAAAALTTLAALLTLGTDAASIHATMRDKLIHVLRDADVPLSPETGLLVDAVISVSPAIAAAFSTMMLALNLWGAAKVTAMSGRLRRPWPDLKALALPPMTLAALFAAIGFSFAGGLVAIVAGIATSALLMAYGLAGFAVLHTLTLSWRSRPFWLGSTYALVTMFAWPVLIMVALGLADAAFGLRQRYWQRQPPPLPVP